MVVTPTAEGAERVVTRCREGVESMLTKVIVNKKEFKLPIDWCLWHRWLKYLIEEGKEIKIEEVYDDGRKRIYFIGSHSQNTSNK